jgi:glycine/D-amino acid oxidase-like deaminating enzyme
VTRVAIVGAGLLGSALADQLAARGAEVIVVERDRPGGGASGATFGWLNAQDKAPVDYFELNLAGMAAHRELAGALGGDWYHPGGDIAIGRGAAAANVRDRIEHHLALGYEVVELDRAGLAAMEPDLDLLDDAATDAFAAAHFAAEAWIDPAALIGRLLARARSNGARILTGAEVLRLETRSGRVVEIVTRSGDHLIADRFVLAAGTVTERLAETAGIRLPMAPTPGLLAISEPVAVTVAHIIHAGEVTLRPDGAGRLMLSSRQLDATLDPAIREISTEAEQCRDLLARARRLLPDIGDARLETARIGVRSVASDGMPVAGFAPGVENLYLLVSHSGATLAPILGRLGADELFGLRQARLESYRPSRFA